VSENNKKKCRHVKNKQQFIERANEIHNFKYDYSKVEFPKREPMPVKVGRRGGGTIATFRHPPEYYREAKVIIICPIHGEFLSRARKHIEKNGSGCQRCARELSSKVRYDKRRVANFIDSNAYEIHKGHIIIKRIPSDGIEREILIDKQDLEVLEYCVWRTTGHQKSRKGRTNYCIGDDSVRTRTEGLSWLGTQPKLHRLIMSRVEGRELRRSERVDHKNHNGLDNRRENLRLASSSQNHANSRKARSSPHGGGVCTSKYKGVYRRAERLHLGWYVCIGSCGPDSAVVTPRTYLGRYPTEEEAAMVYDKAAIRLYGEFAYLNFPERLEEYLAEINK